MNIFQQGDVVVKSINIIPNGDRVRDDLLNKGILALGDATGHCHQLIEQDGVEAFRIMNVIYLKLAKETSLKHQEHHEIKLPPGDYLVDIVREADHMSGVIRRVVD